MIDPLDLWSQFQGISAFMQGEELAGMRAAKIGTDPGGATALTLLSQDRALGGVRDDLYNVKDAQTAYERELRKGTVPANWTYDLPALENHKFTLKGLKDGGYQVTWCSPADGQAIGTPTALTVSGSAAIVPLPPAGLRSHPRWRRPDSRRTGDHCWAPALPAIRLTKERSHPQVAHYTSGPMTRPAAVSCCGPAAGDETIRIFRLYPKYQWSGDLCSSNPWLAGGDSARWAASNGCRPPCPAACTPT